MLMTRWLDFVDFSLQFIHFPDNSGRKSRRKRARRRGNVERLEDRTMLSGSALIAYSNAGHSTALDTSAGNDDGPPTVADGESQTVIGPHHADPGHAGTQTHFFAETGDAHHFAWQDQNMSTPDVIDINYDYRDLGGRWGANVITSGQIAMTELALDKW